MSDQQSGLLDVQRAAKAALREHWALFLVEGVVLLVLGATAVVLPPLATLAVTILFGWLFLVSGIVGLFTLLLIAFFLIEGAATIMFAFDHKRELSGRWGWMLVSGIIDLALALMIFAGLPSTAAWALGLLVGINMIFGGAALIAMSLYARKDAA